MTLITGANGKLGQLVISELLKVKKPNEIIAGVRNPKKAEALKKLGIQVREVDYERPETMRTAFKGVTQILLISSSEIGKRAEQHKNVIEAAQTAGVKHLVYTSVLRAEKSRLGLAKEHLATENLIKKAGLSYTILRNGWYLENHTENLGSALKNGVILGAAGQGRFSSASRSDFAAAAAKVLSTSGHENKIYELAGDTSFTLADLAAVVTKQIGRNVAYKNMTASEYEKTLIGFGLPAPVANLLADSDLGASQGDLESSSKDLSRLIGRPTTTIEQAVSVALQKAH